MCLALRRTGPESAVTEQMAKEALLVKVEASREHGRAEWDEHIDRIAKRRRRRSRPGGNECFAELSGFTVHNARVDSSRLSVWIRAKLS